MSAKKTAWDYHRLAEERNLVWLGPMPRTTNDKSYWKCRGCGEISYRSYQLVSRNRVGCWTCANSAKVTAEDYHALAAERGFKWAGDRVVNKHTSTRWICLTCGYTWKTKYQHIRDGQGCPRCNERAPVTAKDYRDLADKLDLNWLGPLVTANENTQWECRACGTIYERCYTVQANREPIVCRKCEGLKPHGKMRLIRWGRQS